MNCKHTRRAVRSLVCGEKADIGPIQEHLTLCRRCNERYQPFLAIVRSLEDVSPPQLDEESWRQFPAKLQMRIRRERPAPLGRSRSLLLWVEQSKLVRFRKALAASAVAITLAATLVGTLPGLWRDGGEQPSVARQLPTGPAFSFPDLSPAAEEVISIFGVEGFITGVFSGDIQPGDFFGGGELGPDDIVEALDFLLS